MFIFWTISHTIQLLAHPLLSRLIRLEISPSPLPFPPLELSNQASPINIRALESVAVNGITKLSWLNSLPFHKSQYHLSIYQQSVSLWKLASILGGLFELVQLLWYLSIFVVFRTSSLVNYVFLFVDHLTPGKISLH
jgi:hypothetical protein